MAKGNQGYERSGINQDQAASQDRWGQFQNTVGSQTSGLEDQANNERSYLNSGYQNFAQTGGLDPDAVARLRAATAGASGGGSGMTYTPLASRVAAFNLPSRGAARGTAAELSDTGGVDIKKLEESLGGFRDIASSGGYDAASQKSLGDISARLADKSRYVSQDANSLRDFAKTGGVTASDRANIFSPVYDQMEQNGGYSADDIANARNRANSGIESTYSNLRDSMNRTRATTGSSGPGAGAVDFKLARQAAQQSGDTARDTELGIHNQVLQNQMAGANAKTQAQLGLTGITSPAMEAAYRDAGNLTGDALKTENAGLVSSGDITDRTQSTMAKNKLAALTGISDTNRGAQGLIQQGKNYGMLGNIQMDDGDSQYGLQQAGMEDQFNQSERAYANQVAAANASAGRSGAAAQADLEKWLISQGMSGKEFGLGGLSDLYTKTNGPLSENYGLMNDILKNRDSSSMGSRSLNLQNDDVNRSHLAQNIMGGIGMAGGIMGGLAGLGGNTLSSTSYGGAATLPYARYGNMSGGVYGGGQ